MTTKALFGFTLAEVLITLGIIGIVAAMTIPTLMTKFAKSRTETQLKTFYSKINQTVKMSIAENGDPEGWITSNKEYTYEENVEFLKTYFFPYMKTLGYEECLNNDSQMGVCVYLLDGGLMWFSVDENGGDISYWTDINKALDRYKNNNKKIPNITRYFFRFQFAKFTNSDKNKELKSTQYVEPYIYNWDGTREGLKSTIYGCAKNASGSFCTKLIQMSDWKIPSDYPW